MSNRSNKVSDGDKGQVHDSTLPMGDVQLPPPPAQPLTPVTPEELAQQAQQAARGAAAIAKIAGTLRNVPATTSGLNSFRWNILFGDAASYVLGKGDLPQGAAKAIGDACRAYGGPYPSGEGLAYWTRGAAPGRVTTQFSMLFHGDAADCERHVTEMLARAIAIVLHGSVARTASNGRLAVKFG